MQVTRTCHVMPEPCLKTQLSVRRAALAQGPLRLCIAKLILIVHPRTRAPPAARTPDKRFFVLALPDPEF